MQRSSPLVYDQSNSLMTSAKVKYRHEEKLLIPALCNKHIYIAYNKKCQ